MEEAKASWNTTYLSSEGFDCQITLRDEDEVNLAHRSTSMMTSIVKSGGTPLKRKGLEANGNGHAGNGAGPESSPEKPQKTYVDGAGVRRCNLKLKDGKLCNAEVTEREGRYGPFWSCPNFKEHAS